MFVRRAILQQLLLPLLLLLLLIICTMLVYHIYSFITFVLAHSPLHYAVSFYLCPHCRALCCSLLIARCSLTLDQHTYTHKHIRTLHIWLQSHSYYKCLALHISPRTKPYVIWTRAHTTHTDTLVCMHENTLHTRTQ